MSTQYGLFLLSHFDMQARPDRTERALRVFFPAQAGNYLASLMCGDPVLVRQGARDSLGSLAGSLSAQGFKAAVRAIETGG